MIRDTFFGCLSRRKRAIEIEKILILALSKPPTQTENLYAITQQPNFCFRQKEKKGYLLDSVSE